jgi:hypothetical protein
VLSSLRRVRAPLAAGLVWLAGGWLALSDHLPDAGRAAGVIRGAYRMVGAVGRPVALVGLAVLAYLLGLVSVAVSTALMNAALSVRGPTGSARTNLVGRFSERAALADVVLDALAARFATGASRVALPEPEAAHLALLTSAPLPANLRKELIAERVDVAECTRIVQAATERTPDEYGRLRAEGELRGAVAFAALGAGVAILVGAPDLRPVTTFVVGLVVLGVVVGLFGLGLSRLAAARAVLGQALRRDRIEYTAGALPARVRGQAWLDVEYRALHALVRRRLDPEPLMAALRTAIAAGNDRCAGPLAALLLRKGNTGAAAEVLRDWAAGGDAQLLAAVEFVLDHDLSALHPVSAELLGGLPDLSRRVLLARARLAERVGQERAAMVWYLRAAAEGDAGAEQRAVALARRLDVTRVVDHFLVRPAGLREWHHLFRQLYAGSARSRLGQRIDRWLDELGFLASNQAFLRLYWRDLARSEYVALLTRIRARRRRRAHRPVVVS